MNFEPMAGDPRYELARAMFLNDYRGDPDRFDTEPYSVFKAEFVARAARIIDLLDARQFVVIHKNSLDEGY